MTYAEKRARGARIIIRKWVRLKPWENLLIVTSNSYIEDARLLRDEAKRRSRNVDIMVVEEKGKFVGIFFDENEQIFDDYKAIIAATEYSLVTTQAARRAISRGKKFLSLPLSTNDGKSLLSYDFLTMDTRLSRLMAKEILKHLEGAEKLRVTTQIGTDLVFSKANRKAGFFNGVCKDGGGFSSSSIEVYIPIVETATTGDFVIDGSLGYIGRPKKPIHTRIENGRLCQIEDSPDGAKLKAYIDSFADDRLYITAEFGIGLNSISKCLGNCYIEDESTYGTFHIGFGRNLALGGQQEGSGHFDLVIQKPTIYADDQLIMADGVINLGNLPEY